MSFRLKIGFLGAGKMATALAKGFIHSKIVSAKQVTASDVFAPARAAFAKEIGRATASNAGVVKFANVLILAVKPDQVTPLRGEVGKPQITAAELTKP